MSRRAQITCRKHPSRRIGSWQVFAVSQGTEARADSSLVVFRRESSAGRQSLGRGSEWEGAPRSIVTLSRSLSPNLYKIRALKTTLPGIWGTKERGRRSAAGAGVATGPCTWSERALAPRVRRCDAIADATQVPACRAYLFPMSRVFGPVAWVPSNLAYPR